MRNKGFQTKSLPEFDKSAATNIWAFVKKDRDLLTTDRIKSSDYFPPPQKNMLIHIAREKRVSPTGDQQPSSMVLWVCFPTGY